MFKVYPKVENVAIITQYTQYKKFLLCNVYMFLLLFRNMLY